MSVPEFMTRLRLVSSLLPPGLFASEGLSDSPADERLRQKALASADVWLNPDFLAGITPADFWFADDFGRSRLADAFDRFRREAEAVLPGQPPTPEQRQRGLDALIHVIDVLPAVDIHNKFLSRALWELEPRYPEYVLGFDCRFGTDSTGDPAVWIWAIIPDGTDLSSARLDQFEGDIRQTVRAWLKVVGAPENYWMKAAGAEENSWPYVRLRTPSEIQDALTAVAE